MTKEVTMEFGSLLRTARERSGKAAKRIEEEIDLPHGYLSRWERGRASGAYPRGEVIAKLTKALKLSPECERVLELAAVLDLMTRYGFVNGTRDAIVRNAYECAHSLFEQFAFRNSEPYFLLVKEHLSRHSNGWELRWEVTHDLGVTLGVMGRFRDAAQCFREAGQLVHEIDRYREMKSLHEEGLAEMNCGKRVEGFQLIASTTGYWRTSRAYQAETLLAGTLRDQAKALRGIAHSKQILALLMESLQVAKPNEAMQYRLSLSTLAGCQAAFDQFDEARKSYEQLDNWWRPNGTHHIQETAIRVARLAVLHHTGDVQDPSAEIGELMAICQEHEYGRLINILKLLSQARLPADRRNLLDVL